MNNKEIWGVVVKMDDYIYITQMELAYKNISNDNTEVNQKAGIMIGIIGVMFSIQSTIIVSLYPFTNILSYIFIGSLFCYLISIVYFIKNLSVKEYLSLPSPDAVVKYYEEEYTTESFYSTMLGNYQWVINNNMSVVNLKSKYSKKGFTCFCFGLILLTLFFIGYLIL